MELHPGCVCGGVVCVCGGGLGVGVGGLGVGVCVSFNNYVTLEN